MQEYLKTMERFVEVQQQVMEDILNRTPSTAVVASATHPSSDEIAPFPLLGTVVSRVPGQELVARRRLDKEEDLFLQQHTLGGQISLTDETLRPLAVVPLTISMEMLAEAAAALMPGKLLIGMKEVRAHRWIRVEDDAVTLQITARRTSPLGDEVEVQIRNVSDDPEPEGSRPTPAIQGIMVFGDRYPDPPASGEFSLARDRVAEARSADLYGGEVMFHGPCFQGVSSIDRYGEDGLVGQLNVLPADGLFRSTPNHRFVTDPVVLDAAGQLVGFWTAKHLDHGFVVFPYRLEALHIYGPNRPAPERVACHLRLRLFGSDQIRSDLDIVGAEGSVWMRLVGWEDKRFDLPQSFHRFWVAPRRAQMSRSWRTPIADLPASESFECNRLERFFEPGNTFWKDLWASLILTRRERKAFRQLKGPETRQDEWLLGRAAAKDAVRLYLKKRHQLDLLPADIDIGQDEHGRPLPQGPWAREIPVPALSVAHSAGVAVAAAGDVLGRRLGIDLEAIRRLDSGFERLAFTVDEQELLASLPSSAREEWVMRLWCAKEAVAKALGRGLMDGPQSVAAQELDTRTGLVKVALQGKLAEAFPEFAHARLVAHTAREEDYLMASTLCEEASA